MVVRALLVVALVMCVLFAWRAWRPHPAPAALAAALATALGVVLLRHPAFAAAGLVAVAGLLWMASRVKK